MLQTGIAILEDTNLNTPPTSPTERFSWHIGQTPTGVWAGQAGNIATYLPGTGGGGGGAQDWGFEAPFVGLMAYVRDDPVSPFYGAWNDDNTWKRIFPLASFFATKTANQALTASFADIATWATGNETDGIQLNKLTGVATITPRPIAQLDVDINIRSLVTTGPAPVHTEYRLLKNGVLVTSCQPFSGTNNASAVKGNTVSMHATLYDLVVNDTLKIQGLHDGTGGGAASVDGNCCQWRMREPVEALAVTTT